MPQPLSAAFYAREADVVARELLGAVLAHDTPEGRVSGRIVETEAYLGPHDPAAHSAAGLTPRTAPMFGPPGRAYVYFVYGMHWCVNAVTREEGYGAAVLIRAIEPLEGVAVMRARRPRARRDRDLTNGPGKVCAALAITKAQNSVPLTGESGLTILEGEPVPDARVLVTPRVGISKAVEWPLRFLVR